VGRDLPQRTEPRRVMTETIPIKKQNGLPPGSAHLRNRLLSPVFAPYVVACGHVRRRAAEAKQNASKAKTHL
jgi:hypothetical protein